MFSPIQRFCQRLGLPGVALGGGPASVETQGHFLEAHPDEAKITVTPRTTGGFSVSSASSPEQPLPFWKGQHAPAMAVKSRMTNVAIVHHCVLASTMPAEYQLNGWT